MYTDIKEIMFQNSLLIIGDKRVLRVHVTHGDGSTELIDIPFPEGQGIPDISTFKASEVE